MLNQYAAAFAADVVRQTIKVQSGLKNTVADQLDEIASGKWIVVPADSSEKATEEARRVIATVYNLMAYVDPTCNEYRGAVDGAKAYIEKTCWWINDYT